MCICNQTNEEKKSHMFGLVKPTASTADDDGMINAMQLDDFILIFSIWSCNFFNVSNFIYCFSYDQCISVAIITCCYWQLLLFELLKSKVVPR